MAETDPTVHLANSTGFVGGSMNDNVTQSAAKPRPMRQLLPAATAAEERDVVGPSLRKGAVRLQKRPMAKAACRSCKKRKIRCSAERPKCDKCSIRGEPCVYNAQPSTQGPGEITKPQEPPWSFESLFYFMQGSTDALAGAVYMRIRQGVKADTIIRHLESGNLLRQVALVPETRFRYEFPFLREMPASLQYSGNPYLHSYIYEWSTGTSHPQQSWPLSWSDAGGCNSVYSKPYCAANIIEPRLSQVKWSYWTAVCTDDGLMQDILAAFFLYEYSWLGSTFHKDYFLEDAARGWPRFCSPLLVNAILGYGCICYRGFPNRHEYWNPEFLGYKFLAEAKRLWQSEVHRRALTTIQAGPLINTLINTNGMDKIGWAYTKQAVSMAHDMLLFDGSSEFQGWEERTVANFTAWALFNYQSLHCYYMCEPPLILEAPKVTLPDVMEWYGEVWIQYPLDGTLFHSHFGYMFKARCELLTIINDINIQCFTKPSTFSIRKALNFRSRLKDWYGRLPDILSPKRVVLPSHLHLHMQYHTLLMNLFTPYIDVIPAAYEVFPRQIVTEATTCFETLLRLYFLRHGFNTLDLFLLGHLSLLAFSVIKKLSLRRSSLELHAVQSTLLLATKGLFEQGQVNYIARMTLHLLKSEMEPEELALTNLTEDWGAGADDPARLRFHELQSRWPPAMLKITDDPDLQRMENLVKKHT